MSGVPRVRFKGYSDSWLPTVFKDVARVERGLTYSPQDVRLYGTAKTVRVLGSGNIREDRLLLKDTDTHVSKAKCSVDLLEENDILVTASNGSINLVGKRALVPGGIADSVAGGFMYRVVPSNPGFLYAWMGSTAYKAALKYVQGGNGALGNLRKDDLESAQILVPSAQEQDRIGKMCFAVDSLINLQEKKLQHLEETKRTMLAKMFPKKGTTVPELRFDGYSGDWAETQILDEIRAYQPKTLPQSEFTGAGYPVYGANGIIGYTDKYNHDFEQIALACRGTVGSVIRTEKKSWINGNAMVLDISKNDSVDFDFMYHLLGQYNFNRLATGSTQLQITRASLLGAKFYIPSLQEQQDIGQFFKTLDDLIARQEEKVENGKLLKKALLQKMFV